MIKLILEDTLFGINFGVKRIGSDVMFGVWEQDCLNCCNDLNPANLFGSYDFYGDGLLMIDFISCDWFAYFDSSTGYFGIGFIIGETGVLL